MVWGDKIDQFGIVDGEELTVHFDLESREFNGRWYTDVKAWRVERAKGQDNGDMPPPMEEPPPLDGPPPGMDDDDVPF